MSDDAFQLLNELPSTHRPDMSNGVCYEGDVFLARLSARDPEQEDVTYLLTGGSLPSGAFLDPAQGTITGTLTLQHFDTDETLKGDHTWTFTVGAFDGVNIKNQSFSITVKHINLPPVWDARSGGMILEMYEGNSIAQAVVFDAWTVSGTTGNTTVRANSTIISGTVPFNTTIEQTTQDIVASINSLVSAPNYSASYVGGTLFKITAPPGDTRLHALSTGDISIAQITGENSIAPVDANGVVTTDANSVVGYKVIAVSDPEIEFNPNTSVNQALTYRANGALFDGSIANCTFAMDANGVLTGSLPPVDDQLVPARPFIGSARDKYRDFPFQIFANDGEFDVPRSFTLRVRNANVSPFWSNATTNAVPLSANVGFFLEGTTISPITFTAHDVDQDPLTYTISNVSTTNGVVINSIADLGFALSNTSNSGVLTGTPIAFSVDDQEIAASDTTWYVVDGTGLNSTLAGPSYLATTTDNTAVFRSKAGQTVFVSDDNNTEPTPGSRYVIKYSIRKTVDDPSIKSYVRPAFDCFYSNGAISIQGQRSGPGYVSDASDVGWDFFDTTSWVLNQWYTVSAEFTLPDPSPFVAIRGRIRINRAAYDNGGPPYTNLSHRIDGPPYSQAVFEMRGTLLQQNDLSSYAFTVNASDGEFTISRDFTYTLQHIDAPPVWDTTSGSLGTYYANTAVNQQLMAHDPEGKSVSYSLANATVLPVGLSLSATGLISGTLANVSSDTTTVFSVRASDGAKTADRDFSFTVHTANVVTNLPPVWDTPTGDISALDGLPGETKSFQLAAHDPEAQPLMYSVVSGSLPAGFTMTSGGLISGTHQLDVTPDPVNWTDSSASGPTDDSFVPGVSIGGNTNAQGITGINTTITLRITCSRNLNSGENLAIYKNGTLMSSPSSIVQGQSTATFDVVNGDVIIFRFGGYHTTNVTFTVTNTSDSNAVLDTFQSSLTKT